jgi:PAS domain S-box-containing protein
MLLAPDAEAVRLLLSSIRDYAIFLLDTDGRVLSWNAGAAALYGYDADEVAGVNFARFYPPESVQRDWPQHSLAVADMQGRFEDDGWQLRKDGSRLWALSVITALRDSDGKLRSFVNVTRDLTEVRRQQEALRQSEERLRSLVEGARDYAIFTLDPDGNVTSWNAGARQVTGYEPIEVIGSHLSRFYPPEAIEQGLPQQVLAAASMQGRFEEEGWRVHKDGSRIWVNSITTALRDSGGKLRGFARVTRDLTERRRQEEALRQSEERLRSLVEGALDYAIFTLDPDGNVTSWNAGARQLGGYEPGEVIGSHISRFYPPEAIERGLPQQELALANAQGRFEDEGWRVRKDGSRVWVNSVTTALRDSGGKLRGFARVTRDRTDVRRKEEALRQSEERFRSLVEAVRDYAIFTLDADGYVTSWNAGARLIKGYEPDEIIGAHFSRFYPPAAVERQWPQHELAVASVRGHFEDEGWRVRKDGSRFWANVVITAMRRSSGAVLGYSKITRDLTERHRREEAMSQRQERLRQNSKALEQTVRQMREFVAELSHELRGPLAPIRSAASRMAREDLSPTVERLRQTIDRQSGLLGRVLDDLLDMNRIERARYSIELELVQLTDVLSRSIEACRPLIEAHGHALQTQWPAQSVVLRGDGTRLTRAFINLLNNAASYTPDGGQISVLMETTSTDVTVRVKDTGKGIAPDALARIFDPFTRLAPPDGHAQAGPGLGLALVLRIVELHGGTVVARSEGVGFGSEFVVTLPLIKDATRSVDVRGDGRRSARAVRILCVDDNPDVANTLAKLLEAMGHETQTAHEAGVALRAARIFRPEVVLVDIDTAGMNGYELAKRLLEQQREAPPMLVALTAWARTGDQKRAQDAGFQRYLLKPVTREAVEGVLAILTPFGARDSSSK